MTPHQIALVQDSFQRVKPIAPIAATLFYDKLFELAPTVRPMFKRDIGEQGQLLMATLATAVSLLRHPDKLTGAVEALGRRHAGYGVQAAHFQPVGEALLWTLEQGLGKGFTPEIRDAWAALYQVVTETMSRGLSQAAQQKAMEAAAAIKDKKLRCPVGRPQPPAVQPWWKRLFASWVR